jgi:ABC transport system ATP-binding/permease protein
MDNKQTPDSEIIQALLNCQPGEEVKIHEQYKHSMDEHLVEKMLEEADRLEKVGNSAPWLRKQAEIIRAIIGISIPELNFQTSEEIDIVFRDLRKDSRRDLRSYLGTKEEEFEIISEQSFPDSNNPLVYNLNVLTRLYQSQGRLKKIKPYYDQVIKIWKELYGENLLNKNVAFSLNKIGELFASQKKWVEAKGYYEEALRIWRELYGDSSNNDLATTLNNLGKLYASQGKNTNAKDYYEQALETWRELYQARPNDNLATTLNNLGELYASQERWTDARPLYKKALAIRRELYQARPNNDLATTLNNLGELYAAQERWTDARPLYEKALAIRRELYQARPNNDLATTLNNLAVLHRSQERWAEAEPLYKEALEIRRKLYEHGPNKDLATSLNNLAILYSLQKEPEKAKPLYEEAQEIRQKLCKDLLTKEPVDSVSNLAELCKSEEITLGRDPSATLQLDSPTVDWNHATITKDPNGRYILKDENSTNGVFVDGQRVDNTQTIYEGAEIKINPFTLTLRDDELQLLDSGDRIRLDVDQLTLETWGKFRLCQLSFAIEPGQFVALVGGSGAGKSTLMRALLGVEKPTCGAVYINGNDLRQNFDLYRNQIGYVPQDDIIHMDLSVEKVLEYAAKLRLPPDTDWKEIVNRVLIDIDMEDRRTALIKNLSGGQRKRVSIGVELLANPKLFFLDEPTSGLDPGLDKQMMELLRDLAHNDDRTIVLVTHATANITDCDRVVFLGEGGKLCYFGTPAEALTFFKVTDFATIYIKLQNKNKVEVDYYADLYENSSYFQKYIANNLRPNSNNEKFLSAKKANSISQWKTLTLRYFNLIISDRANLILALLTAPVGIILMYFAVRDRDPFILGIKDEPGLPGLALQVLFVFTCASLWVGLSSSLQEIVKESAIYSRERLVNLRLRSYLSSKVAVLATLAVVQTILIAIFITIGFKSPTFNLIPWQIGIFITTFLTLTASFSLGLLVSTAVKNSTRATSALPLLLLPQIIFSGVLFKLQDVTAALSYFMLSRWAIGAYGTIVNINELLPESMKTKWIGDMPFPTGIAYESTWSNLRFNWLMLLAHITFYLAVTALLQKRKDIL